MLEANRFCIRVWHESATDAAVGDLEDSEGREGSRCGVLSQGSTNVLCEEVASWALGLCLPIAC